MLDDILLALTLLAGSGAGLAGEGHAVTVTTGSGALGRVHFDLAARFVEEDGPVLLQCTGSRPLDPARAAEARVRCFVLAPDGATLSLGSRTAVREALDPLDLEVESGSGRWAALAGLPARLDGMPVTAELVSAVPDLRLRLPAPR